MILLSLFLAFFRIGVFSFGGGLAMLPLIFQTVQDFGYMSAEEFSNLVALSQITPGPVAVNAATFIGFSFAGLGGALCATFGVALPSFLLIITVIKFLDKFNNNKSIDAAFKGIRPATVGLIASAALFVGQTALVKSGDSEAANSVGADAVTNAANITNALDITSALSDVAVSLDLIPCLIFVVSFVLISKFKLSPVKIILLTAVVGAVFCN